MKAYKVGDKILFHLDVIHIDPVEGEVVEIGGNGLYIIQHKGLKCGVQEKFIVSKVFSDKEIIHDLEKRILDDDQKLKSLNKQLAVFEKELETLRETIMRQKNRINELERNQRSPFDGYNFQKRRKQDPPFPFPSPSIPQWRCDLDDHETYRKKYSCKCLEH